ncbi:hypothetical protein PsYK624_165440 [Phanerochaete sordida]|uniref:Uncharacterized protein n=1 Tax=Phanerochaete sordida TaxID=48140 RepID=A0A9P3GTC6_9APHY|nr:hypothetical protein PsYK624_165440 [Phanerochaete sordida]
MPPSYETQVGNITGLRFDFLGFDTRDASDAFDLSIFASDFRYLSHSRHAQSTRTPATRQSQISGELAALYAPLITLPIGALAAAMGVV